MINQKINMNGHLNGASKPKSARGARTRIEIAIDVLENFDSYLELIMDGMGELTQQEFSSMSGGDLSRSTISLLTSKLQTPSLRILKAVVKIVNQRACDS